MKVFRKVAETSISRDETVKIFLACYKMTEARELDEKPEVRELDSLKRKKKRKSLRKNISRS